MKGVLDMSSEVVKYHNDLNTVPMRNWTKEEMDFFFAILSKMKNKGTEKVVFNKSQLVDLIKYDRREVDRFYKTFENLGHKVSQIYYFEKSSHSMRFMHLFNEFRVDWNDDYSDVIVTISASSNFEYILNKFEAEFTQYELAEFTLIRSTYAKTMYRLLKQWRTVGLKKFEADDFKKLLDIPVSYGVSDIEKRVLAPIKKELPVFFKNLKIKKIKANTRGNPVIAYEFRWEKEKVSTWDPNKYDKDTHKPYSKKIEKLPEWATNGHIKKEDTFLSPEQQAVYQERLKRIRENKPK